MTDADLEKMPPGQREQMKAALAAKAEHEAELARIRAERRSLAPVWARLAAVPDSFGLELEIALVPRGTR